VFPPRATFVTDNHFRGEGSNDVRPNTDARSIVPYRLHCDSERGDGQAKAMAVVHEKGAEARDGDRTENKKRYKRV